MIEEKIFQGLARWVSPFLYVVEEDSLLAPSSL
jgi:hypothetical protein